MPLTVALNRFHPTSEWKTATAEMTQTRVDKGENTWLWFFFFRDYAYDAYIKQAKNRQHNQMFIGTYNININNNK